VSTPTKKQNFPNKTAGMLHILPRGDCKKLINISKGYSINSKYEICAGKKKPLERLKLYNKVDDDFEYDTEVINRMGLTDYDLDYYISETDQCNGDSGGPLYMWRNGRPYLVGVISRGWGSEGEGGCGEFNYPGIYQRVAKHLMWLHRQTRDGNC